MTETAKTRAGAGNVWKRFLSLLLAFAMMLTFVPAPMGVTTAYADAPSTLYLTPNANWKNDGARFAAYFFGNGGSTWVSMTDTDGDGKYEAAVPAGDYANVIFCRMSGTAAANDWANKWTQTGDLVIPTDGKNWYTVDEGQWDSGSNGVWDTYTPAPVPPAASP